jgi:hypothetical protein
LLAVFAAEHVQNAIAVMRKIGMNAYPAAVAAAIDTGNAIPQLGGRATVDAQITLAAKLGCRVSHIDCNILGATGAQLVQLAGGQRSGGDADLRDGTDCKRRGEQGFGAGELRAGQCRSGVAGVLP